MDVTFIINGQDFAPVLSTYEVVHIPEYETEVKTIDRKLHKIGEAYRTNIRFSTFPFDDMKLEDSRAYYKRPMIVEFTDFDYGCVRTMEFMPDNEIQRKFGMKNLDGVIISKGNELHLVAVEVDADAPKTD